MYVCIVLRGKVSDFREIVLDSRAVNRLISRKRQKKISTSPDE